MIGGGIAVDRAEREVAYPLRQQDFLVLMERQEALQETSQEGSRRDQRRDTLIGVLVTASTSAIMFAVTTPFEEASDAITKVRWGALGCLVILLIVAGVSLVGLVQLLVTTPKTKPREDRPYEVLLRSIRKKVGLPLGDAGPLHTGASADRSDPHERPTLADDATEASVVREPQLSVLVTRTAPDEKWPPTGHHLVSIAFDGWNWIQPFVGVVRLNFRVINGRQDPILLAKCRLQRPPGGAEGVAANDMAVIPDSGDPPFLAGTQSTTVSGTIPIADAGGSLLGAVLRVQCVVDFHTQDSIINGMVSIGLEIRGATTPPT